MPELHDGGSQAVLDRVADDLKAAFVRTPDAGTESRHLAAMAAAARGVAALDSGAGARSRPRRRTSRTAVASVIAGATIVVTGGLAAAGVLPAPLQTDVARLVRPLGITLPHATAHPSGGHGARPAPATGTPTNASTGPTATSGVTSSTASGSPAGSSSTDATGAKGAKGDTAEASTGSSTLPASATTTTTVPAATTTTVPPGRSGTAPGHRGGAGNNKPTTPPGQAKKPHDSA
jgi:hypothetical protein